MYGLVNKAIRDFSIEQVGEAGWRKICRNANVTVEDFVSMSPYDDSLTYALVASASEELRIDAPELLTAFGRYWITFSAAEGYGALLDMWGRDFVEFLENLDGLHARVRLSFPELRPPRITCKRIGEQELEVCYHSEREGLAPFFIGLLRGLGERFRLRLEIEHEGMREVYGYDRFRVRHEPDG